MQKKDYAYRSTWKHKFSRARNKAQRGGLSKKEMLKNVQKYYLKDHWLCFLLLYGIEYVQLKVVNETVWLSGI